MKRKCVGYLLTLLLMIVPLYIKADTYNSEVNNTNEYVLRSDFINDYQRYLLDGRNLNIPYGFTKGKIGNVSEFRMGGFISKDEFMVTSNNSETNSYLFDGIKYWTLTSDGSKKYIVGESGSKDQNSNYRNKTTEYTKNEVKVTGSGTIKDPWVFEPVYKVDVNAENGIVAYPTGQYVNRDNVLTVTATPNEGYRYITNDCGVYFENYNTATNELKISRVNRDISCNLIFGLGIYKIKLEEADVSPKEFYLRYNEDFYRDEAAQQTFRALDKNPAKVGYTFMGYEYTQRNGTKTTIIDQTGKTDKSKSGVITEDTTLKALWQANKYTVTFNANGGTVSQSSMTVTYNSQYGTLPTPVNKGYSFDGWYTASTGGDKILNTTIVNRAMDHILYAHWTTCAAGTYNDGTTTNCQTCPTGYTSAAKSTAINQCYISVGAGKYLTAAKGTTSANCAAGTYKAAHTVNYGNSDSCTACAANTYAVAGSSSCTPCATGYTVAAGQGKAATSCIVVVPAGKRVTAAGKAPEDCPANTYASTSRTINQTQTATCTNCASGYTSSPGASVCIDAIKPTCTLTVQNGLTVSFASKSDNIAVTSFGISTSTTPVYNNASSVGASAATFYGYVKDAAGNTGTCSIRLKSQVQYSRVACVEKGTKYGSWTGWDCYGSYCPGSLRTSSIADATYEQYWCASTNSSCWRSRPAYDACNRYGTNWSAWVNGSCPASGIEYSCKTQTIYVQY